MNLKTRRVRIVSGVAATTLTMAGLAAATAPAAQANAQGAITTTINAGVDAVGGVTVEELCANGNPDINCNIYGDKSYVWLSGIDTLKDGTYFFAVLNPSGQGSNDNPNDGTPNNLSDGANGDYTTRTFTVTGGQVSYPKPPGTHDFDADNDKIRLANYDDTKNPGGVYILAVCRIDNTTYPVNPSSCKYDAFKVRTKTPPPPDPIAQDPAVAKTAWGDFDKTYTWTLTKSVDKPTINQAGGTQDVEYTVKATPDAGTIGNVRVTGFVLIDNPNNADITGVTLKDTFSLGEGLCTLESFDGTLPANKATTLDFSCALTAVPSSDTDVTNKIEVTWPDQTLLIDAVETELKGKTISDTTEPIDFAKTDLGECVVVTDVFDGGAGEEIGTVCVGDASYEIKYTKTITVPNFGCYVFNNTATSVADDTEETDTASASVTACGTIGHTMGFWQNKNGQGLILNAGSSTVNYNGVNVTACTVTHDLRAYNPFKDLPATANCTVAAKYVFDRIKEASAAGAAMNRMLKGQMLATALTVYFTKDPNSGLKAKAWLGDLTVNTTPWKGAFNNQTSMKVTAMLAYASSQSNDGGSIWYGQVKATQGLAKDAFDAINNQKV